jgi:hypothetical protein
MKLWFLVLTLTAGAVSAQPLQLPYGTAAQQLGVYRDGDYLRGPQSTSLASDGTLWIADSYKARAAHFSRQGVYLGETALSGVSPRQVFFQRRAAGFVTVNDQTITVWGDDGTAVNQWTLGLALPDAVWATETGVFALFSDASGSFCMQWLASGTTKSALRLAGQNVAAIQDGRAWMTRWKDQKTIFGWTAPVTDDARLLAWTADGRSVWVRRTVAGEGQLWWVNPKGDASVTQTFEDVRSRGTSVTASASLDVVIGQWSNDAYEITVLSKP